MESLNRLIGFLPLSAAAAVRREIAASGSAPSELRLRAGAPCMLVFSKKRTLAGDPLSQAQIAGLLQRLCGFSLHALASQLRKGSFVACGCRIGLAGTFPDGGTADPSSCSSLCIRLLRQHIGSGDALSPYLSGSILIAGQPGSGKTSLLRDLVRMAATAPFLRNVAVVDTRQEIAACEQGVSPFDLGQSCDLLTGIGRAEGVDLALRSLSPELLACDEVFLPSELDALCRAAGAGVPVYCTAHLDSVQQLRRKDAFLLWMRCCGNGVAVFLSGRETPGQIAEIHPFAELVS